ncbi:MAG: WbqC family protein [Bacteroidota bacterium]
MKNLVAITQPDFFPWLGSIEKIAATDTFIFLDHVTNRPNDGLWTKRVKVILNGEPKWLGVSLKKDPEREFVPINEMVIDYENKFQVKHLSSIKQNYGKAPFFKDVFPLVEEVYEAGHTLIAKFNGHFILSLCKKLHISTQVFYSSEMKPASNSNELLIELVKMVNGDAYLHGEGSLDYLNPALWEKENICLVPQKFTHPVYPQFNTKEFQKGLSVIDALMNCGFEQTSALLRRPEDFR